MSDFELQSLAEAAATLADQHIHVWRVAYRPALGRQPLLHVLAAYLDCAESAVVLESEEHGRPRLAAGAAHPLDFNWSHSGGDALIAIGRGVRLGVDVERLRPRPRLLEIARRYFGELEFSLLEQLPESDRLPAFLGIWTAKEAVLKALGRGIAFGLDRVGIAMTAGGTPTLRHLAESDVGTWQLRAPVFGPGLFSALAWKGEPRQIRTGMLATKG